MFNFIAVVLFGCLVGGQSFVIESTIKPSGCRVNINKHVGKPSPVFVYPHSTYSLRASDANGNFHFKTNETILITCPGWGNYVKVAGFGVQEVTATCSSETEFLVNGVKHHFNKLSCQLWPASVTEVTGSCLSGRTLLKTGFHISTGFVELYDTCVDQDLAHTHYTKVILGRDADGFQMGVSRPDWIAGDLFGYLDPTNLYRRVTQRHTLTYLLGSTHLAEKFIHLSNDYFLSKGHLVAKADFLHGAHQMATFWYTNAAPQWQTFNGNNWNSLENDCRKHAAVINSDLEVYTGTAGRATLPDVNGNMVNLYLSKTKQIPAPRIFWKILYNPLTQAGIAFIGFNNPFQTLDSIEQDIRCTDICDQIDWLTWYQKDIKRGYSLCCEVNEFREAYPDVPYLPVSSILL